MIKEENELSIIIPTLNCFFYTKQLVDSLFAGVGKKLILIDNGSKDETRKYFETRKLIYNDRVILNDMNIGVAGSWNLGIRTAIRDYDSRYFCLLNNDILLHPKAIQCMLEHLKSGKYALISGTDVCGQLNYAHQIFKKILPDKEIINEAPEFSCFMLSRETVDILEVEESEYEPNAGLFDEHFYPAYFEDNDYHYRLKLRGLKGVKTNMAQYFHYGSRTIEADREIKEQSDRGYVINREYYIKKWGGRPGAETYDKPFDK